MPPLNRTRLLTLVLRLCGAAMLLALGAVLMPFAWMDRIHAGLGLGPLPAAPITSYLARSLSLFYAFFGALFLYLSRDVERHRAIIRVLALLTLPMAALQVWVDWTSGLPASWVGTEGPFALGLALLLLALCRAPKAD